MEADSLNSAILVIDAVPGHPEFDLFVKDMRKEMTVKWSEMHCGASVFVPTAIQEEFQAAPIAQLQKTKIGDLKKKESAWGRWLQSPVQDVLDQVARLSKKPNGSLARTNKPTCWPTTLNTVPFWPCCSTRASRRRGCARSGLRSSEHCDACDDVQKPALANRGLGSLCCSITTIPQGGTRIRATTQRTCTVEFWCWTGTAPKRDRTRLAHASSGTWAGPAEAVKRWAVPGIKHYMQRTAIQGHPIMLTADGTIPAWRHPDRKRASRSESTLKT